MTLRQSLSLILILPAVIAAAFDTFDTYELGHRVLSAVDPSSRVWDMSALERMDDAAAVYGVFGDSLVCECVDDFSMWYGFTNDTVAWLRGEDRLSRCEPIGLLMTSAWPTGKVPQAFPYVSRGMYCRRLHLLEVGDLSSEPPVAGLIVTEAGDSVPALMTAERRVFRSAMTTKRISAEEVAACDTLPLCAVTRYRWFMSPSRLPIAVMTLSEITAGDEHASATTFYALGANELPEVEVPDPSSVAVTSSDGNIILCLPEGASAAKATVAVTTLDGLPALSTVATLLPGTPVTVAASHLPKGRYIVAIEFAGESHKSYLEL